MFLENRYRWLIVFLLFFITITNYIDRASISFAIDIIKNTFHLSDTQIGFILGAFGIGYAVTTLLGGIFVDHYGARITLLLTVAFWSLALFFTGMSTGFMMVFIARTLLGLAEGPNFPAMTRAIADWLPIHERGKSLSAALIAVPVALAVGGPIVSQLIIHVSWRGMFFTLGAVGLLWLIPWWIFFRDLPRDVKEITPNELALIENSHQTSSQENNPTTTDQKEIPGLWKILFTNPTLLANYWAFFVFGYFLFYFMNWLPDYLEQVHHLHLRTVGYFSLLPWGFGALMMWLVGLLSDAVYNKTKSLRLARSYPIMISQLLATLCLLPILFSPHLLVCLLAISLAVGFSMSANAAYFAVNIDIIQARAGTALGVMDMVFAIAGFVAPVITGWLISDTGNFTTAFSLLVGFGLSSVIMVACFHQPDRDIV